VEKNSVDGQRRCTRERKRGRQERRAGILGRVVYRRNSAIVSQFSGERFLPDGGVPGLDSRGRKERRVWLEWEGVKKRGHYGSEQGRQRKRPAFQE
jgi:hypothetical protein